MIGADTHLRMAGRRRRGDVLHMWRADTGRARPLQLVAPRPLGPPRHKRRPLPRAPRYLAGAREAAAPAEQARLWAASEGCVCAVAAGSVDFVVDSVAAAVVVVDYVAVESCGVAVAVAGVVGRLQRQPPLVDGYVAGAVRAAEAAHRAMGNLRQRWPFHF